MPMRARLMVAIYRLTIASLIPDVTSCSMNARIVAGSAGRNESPRPLQNAWNIVRSAFCARSVLAENASSAILCHSCRRPTALLSVAQALAPRKILAIV
jgi:hypothetical protein